jgi:hypothetical protein
MNSENIIDQEVRHLVAGLLTDEQAYQQEQARSKPKYLSAALKTAISAQRKVCARCGDVSGTHDGGISCPWSNASLLAPSS